MSANGLRPVTGHDADHRTARRRDEHHQPSEPIAGRRNERG
jgi:hypothetical protein